jgi:hypothetical protein
VQGLTAIQREALTFMLSRPDDAPPYEVSWELYSAACSLVPRGFTCWAEHITDDIVAVRIVREKAKHILELDALAKGLTPIL